MTSLGAPGVWLGGCSSSGDTASPCSTVCGCVGQKSGTTAEQSCMDQCLASAATKPSDPVAQCVKDLTAGGYTQCIDSCVAFAPPTKSLGNCIAFRQTARIPCTADGPREPLNDKSCFETILSGTPGYCECELGHVPIDCGHLEGTCDDACRKGYFGTLPSGTGGAPNDSGTGSGGGPQADAASDGSPLLPDGGDPCTAYYDLSGRGYACGANLGADPTRLYLCNAGATEGSVICPSGCAAAPAGQPNYCYGTDPCVNSPFDGARCGADLATPLADSRTLYICNAQTTTNSSLCTNGCFISGSATNDYCL